MLRNKNNSFVYLISSLPSYEMKELIKKFKIPENNYKVFSHNDKKDYFEEMYNEMSNYKNYMNEGKQIYG